MSDALPSLIAAYRAENPGASLDARALRARVLSAARQRGHQRARRVAFLIPIAALLVGTGALAASAPARTHLTHLFARLTAAPPRPVEQRAPIPAHPAAHRPPQTHLPPAVPTLGPTLPPTAELAPTAPILSPELPVPPVPAPHHLSPRSLSGPTSPSPLPPAPATPSPSPSTHALTPAAAASADFAPASAPDPALAADVAAYRAAHRLHFVSADYGQALTAWNSYLAHFPAGTFAPEARLNRAVCLARLGHPAEARTALTAIANGRDGQYGTAQAKRLLEALDAGR